MGPPNPWPTLKRRAPITVNPIQPMGQPNPWPTLKRRAPITVYNALLKENFTTTDLAKLNRAIAQLPTAAAVAADHAKAPAEKKRNIPP